VLLRDWHMHNDEMTRDAIRTPLTPPLLLLLLLLLLPDCAAA
jgi:hypothetical protein